MVCEPDLITTGEAMYMKFIVINLGWYTVENDYLWNGTGESFSILDLQPYIKFLSSLGPYFCKLLHFRSKLHYWDTPVFHHRSQSK